MTADEELIADAIAAFEKLGRLDRAEALRMRKLAPLTKGEIARPYVLAKLILMDQFALDAKEAATTIADATGLDWDEAYKAAREKVDGRVVADAKKEYESMTPQQISEHLPRYKPYLPKRFRQISS